ncbi:MAG TPA: efflux RND transporter periplasmic adaptor subunit [Azospirillaceae bacterium]|nr:efflux RND transporter periplasmic adaptor subunit [Azospirillaceae bacterium]
MSYSQPVEPVGAPTAKQPKPFAVTGGVMAQNRRGSRRRYWIIGSAVVALVAGGAAVALWPKGGPAPAAGDAKQASTLTVTVMPVQRTAVGASLPVTGSLAAWDELIIGAEAGGMAVTEVLVDVGDRVEAGQVLARFNDSVLRAELMQREAAVREAEATAAEAVANVRRSEELSKGGHVSARELDNKRATAATAQARVAVAQANREQTQARLRQAEVRAPADGTVTARMARLGMVAGTGSEMFRMIRDDRVELAAEVPEVDLGHLKAGQSVSLSIDGDRTRTFEGKVRLVSPTVDAKTRMGIVKIDVPTDPALKPGMFARGRVQTGTLEALAVPENAVVYKDSRPTVFTVDEQGKAHAHVVETGARDKGRIALLSGIQEGARIVVAGAGYLKEGDQVTVADKMPDVPVKPLPKTN